MKQNNETIDRWAIERELMARGITPVCGCDEAGAGPLAGPVYAAAVILPPELIIDGLNDSKQLSERKREELFDIITSKAIDCAIVSVDVAEIEETNILRARLHAMDMAIHKLSVAPAFALIDGNRNMGISVPNQMVVKGDSLSANIAAASILAKVSRDRYMLEMDRLYPQYGFAKHKGYGTRAHYAALREYGVSPIHRPSFLKKGLHGEDE